MTQLQQLETKIRQALPRLQEMVSKGTILGMHNYYKHHIYLSDVLEWLGKVEYHSVTVYGTFTRTDKLQGQTKWDLSKPLLKDQPKEVIEYLNNLVSLQ